MVDLGECITVLVTSEQAEQNQAWSHSSDEALGGALPTTPTSKTLLLCLGYWNAVTVGCTAAWQHCDASHNGTRAAAHALWLNKGSLAQLYMAC